MSNQTTRSIIVNGDVSRLYKMLADFRNYPRFMEHVTFVAHDEPDINHWVMEGPLDTKLKWTTKTTRLEPNKRIAWKTIEGDLKMSGQVTFTDLPNGQAEITVTSQTIPPDNMIEMVASTLFEDEGAQLEKDLRRFKALVEERSSPPANKGAIK